MKYFIASIFFILTITTSAQDKHLSSTVNSCNQFSIQLLKTDQRPNHVISSFGIYHAMVGAYRAAGETTFIQIHKGMFYLSPKLTFDLLKYAEQKRQIAEDHHIFATEQNKLWIDSSMIVIKDYEKEIKNKSNITIERLSFHSPTPIQTTLQNTDRSTIDLTEALFVISAEHHFTGQWRHDFDPEETSKDDFFLADSSKTAKIDYMHQNIFVKFNENSDIQIIEIPYADNLFSIIIFLPKKYDQLAVQEKKLNTLLFDFYTSSLYEKPVSLYFPKITLESKGSVQHSLQQLGINDLFSDKANLQGMTPKKLSLFDFIFHSSVTFTELQKMQEDNEFSDIYEDEGDMGLYEEIRINHPFLFFIKENNSGLIYYSGRVTNPDKLNK